MYSEIKFRIAISKAAFNKNILSIGKLDLNLRKKVFTYCIWSIILYDAEIWTHLEVDQK
jgi:hypothetical protein